MQEVGPSLVRRCYPERPEGSRKHDFGYVAVVGGSQDFTGAPVLAGLAAMRAGADLSFIITPRRPFWAAVQHPDLVPVDLGTEFVSGLNEDAWAALGKSDALVIGNGLTRRPEVEAAARDVLAGYDKPVVVDGDALYFLERLEVASGDVVLTPHRGEFKALHGDVPKGPQRRAAAVRELSEETGFTVLLKGHEDIIAGTGRLAVSRTGTPYMTVGGTGDVLAGVCGALLARGTGPFESACCAAWLTGRAGGLASSELGEGLMATDVIGELPRAIISAAASR